jgi:L-lactate dehydrogenase
MKVGIVGAGLVGSTAAYAMVMRGVGREIVLVDLDEQKAEAEAADILHAAPFAHPVEIKAAGYADLEGCKVVIITAGVSQKPGETRLELLERNAGVFQKVIPQILQYAFKAIILVATNPVDVMTHLTGVIVESFGIDSTRVLGTGTTLDTARFRALLGKHLGVDPQHVHGYVLGEHGDSEVLTWSLVTVAGVPLEDFCGEWDICTDDDVREQIDMGVRNAAYQIIEGKGSTYYGVGSAIARIVEVILRNQRSILTVCTPLSELLGVEDVTVSMPHLLAGDGVMDQILLPLSLNDNEKSALQYSASVVKEATDEILSVVSL